jgi:hypothetical protein
VIRRNLGEWVIRSLSPIEMTVKLDRRDAYPMGLKIHPDPPSSKEGTKRKLFPMGPFKKGARINVNPCAYITTLQQLSK